jgi:hypothetical protein
MPKIQKAKQKCAQNTKIKTQVCPKYKTKNTSAPKIQKAKHIRPKLGYSVAKYEDTSAIFSVLRRLQYKYKYPALSLCSAQPGGDQGAVCNDSCSSTCKHQDQ